MDSVPHFLMTDDNMAIRVFRQGDSITSPLPNPIGSRPFQYQRNDRALALLVLACAAPLTQAVDTWQDASPHRSGIVDANGIQRHYLDWGGSGEAMVFLAGKTPAFHAIGMTRRGFGQSDPPDAGYDVPGRVADLVAFLKGTKWGPQ